MDFFDVLHDVQSLKDLTAPMPASAATAPSMPMPAPRNGCAPAGTG